MAHTPHDTERVIEKAFLVRFFTDGGFRIEGPFPPMQVQRLIDTNECQAWLRDPALFAIWGREPDWSSDDRRTVPWPGEFSIAGNMLVLPGIGRIPIPGDAPPKGKNMSVTLQEDGDGWTATVEVEEDDERGSER